MKKYLLLSLACVGAVALSGSAQTPTVRTIANPTSTESIRLDRNRLMPGSAVQTTRLSDKATLRVFKSTTGLRFKRIATEGLVSQPSIDIASIAAAHNAAQAEELGSDVALMEDFEGCTGEDGWLPDGWAIQSLAAIGDDPVNWQVIASVPAAMAANGDYYAAINYSADYVDEWLMTQEVTVPENSVLQFKAFIDPVYLFDLNYVDWDLFEFTEYQPGCTVQIMAKEEGDEQWILLKDYYDDYVGWSLMDMMYASPSELQTKNIDLTAYAGKKMQFAFRYVGTDGQITFIDDVMVGPTPLSLTMYWPAETLYYGVTTDFGALPYSIAVMPVYTPLTWSVESDADDATYSWAYHDPITDEIATTTGSVLTQTYQPDYTNEFTTQNNLYETPTAYGTASGFSEGTTKHFDYFQAGGRAEWSSYDYATETDKLLTMGMTTFDINTEGFDIFTIDNDTEASTPIFGYDPYVDAFWTDYTFAGDQGEGDGVKLVAIMNVVRAPIAPLAVKGAWLHAKGQIGENALFTMQICPINDEGLIIDPIASATCPGSALIMMEGGMQNFYAIPFIFDQTAVLDNSTYSMYVVRFSGFNDPDNVTYFAPFQSIGSNPFMSTFGYLEKAMTFNGETNSSLSPIYRYTGGIQSFSICLDAAYPWLVDAGEPVESIELGSESYVLALSSYYDGSEIAVTQADGSALPDWLDVAVAGRYGETAATFTATGSMSATCTVTLSAPGVAKTVEVSYSATSGIADIGAAANSEVTETYNIAGQRIDNATAKAPGIYIMRRSDGTAVKSVVR